MKTPQSPLNPATVRVELREFKAFKSPEFNGYWVAGDCCVLFLDGEDDIYKVYCPSGFFEVSLMGLMEFHAITTHLDPDAKCHPLLIEELEDLYGYECLVLKKEDEYVRRIHQN